MKANRRECTAAVKKFAAAQKYDQAALVAVFADQNDKDVITAMLFAAARIIRGCPEFHGGINFYYLVFKNRKLNQFIAQSINKLPLPDRFKCNIDMKKTIGSTPAESFSMKLSFMFRILPWFIIPACPVLLFIEIVNCLTPRTAPLGYDPELFGELFLRNLHFYKQK